MIATLLELVCGLGASDSNLGLGEQVSHECTVCGTTFDTEVTTCPSCDSHLFRTQTRYPYARVTLLAAVGLAGLQMVRNVLVGNYPKEGPAAGPPSAEKSKRESSGDRPVQP